MKYLFALLFIIISTNSWAQSLIKEKMEVAYRITATDSIVLSTKQTFYDTLGRMEQQQVYYYNSKGSLLQKEEKRTFDFKTQILTERMIEYPGNSDPKTKKLETKFLVYAPDATDNKYIWRKLYDDSYEIIKEDTLTYDVNQNLINKCTYDYRGSTSLFCDYYTFNKYNKQSKWITYSKWTTIDGKGEVVEKSTKRRNNKYCYNKNGLLKHAKGKYYTTRFCQKVKYDKNGQILSDKTTVKRKVKQLKEPKDKEKGKENVKKKYVSSIQKDVHQILYQNGKKIEETKTRNGSEQSKIETFYQDSLTLEIKKYLREKMAESIKFDYDSSHTLIKKTIEKYNTNGKPRFSIVTHFDSNRNPIKEEQFIQGKKYTTLQKKFDQNGNVQNQSLSTHNSQNLEKTMYIYKYY